MRTVGDMMMENVRITPVKFENRVKWIRTNFDGSMLVVQESGNEFTIPAGELDIQALLLYIAMNSELNESEGEARARR